MENEAEGRWRTGEDPLRSSSALSSSRSESLSSATSTLSSFRWESFDADRDRPLVSEVEEIPSPRFWRSSPSFWSTPSRRLRSRRDDAKASSRRAVVTDACEARLPPDYKEILARAVVPVRFSSFEDLYARLCTPILVDGGSKSFTLEGPTGKKCYMLSTRDLDITWGSGPRFLLRDPIPESRFMGTAERQLLGRSFHIVAQMDVRALSPETAYVAYLVFKISSKLFFQGSLDASVVVGGHTSQRTVWLEPEETIKRGLYGSYEIAGKQYYKMHKSVEQWVTKIQDILADVGEPAAPIIASKRRADGWLEVELGEFFVGDGDTVGVVQVRVEDARGVNRRGVIVEGIDFRPKDSSAHGDVGSLEMDDTLGGDVPM